MIKPASKGKGKCSLSELESDIVTSLSKARNIYVMMSLPWALGQSAMALHEGLNYQSMKKRGGHSDMLKKLVFTNAPTKPISLPAMCCVSSSSEVS